MIFWYDKWRFQQFQPLGEEKTGALQRCWLHLVEQRFMKKVEKCLFDENLTVTKLMNTLDAIGAKNDPKPCLCVILP